MTKSTSKEDVLESLSSLVVSIVDTHNLNCFSGDEVTIEELVGHLCFQYKANNDFLKFINKTKNEEY